CPSSRAQASARKAAARSPAASRTRTARSLFSVPREEITHARPAPARMDAPRASVPMYARDGLSGEYKNHIDAAESSPRTTLTAESALGDPVETRKTRNTRSGQRT